jgi:hypothetical protein
MAWAKVQALPEKHTKGAEALSSTPSTGEKNKKDNAIDVVKTCLLLLSFPRDCVFRGEARHSSIGF